MRLRWLKRSHLLNEIEYLCEPIGFNAVLKQVSESFLVRFDTGRKPHGKTRAPRHRMNTPAVEGSACVEPHEGWIAGKVLAWVGVHPSRRRIVAGSKCHQRYDRIVVGPVTVDMLGKAAPPRQSRLAGVLPAGGDQTGWWARCARSSAFTFSGTWSAA